VISEQSFFPSPYYSTSTYGEKLEFGLSEAYQRDTVTLHSGIDYFCGYPTYEVEVKNNKDVLVFSSSLQKNARNIATLTNHQAQPPLSSAYLSFYSTDNSDWTSIYSVTLKVKLNIVPL